MNTDMLVLLGGFVGTLGDPILVLAALLGYLARNGPLGGKKVFVLLFVLGFGVSELLLHNQQPERDAVDMLRHAGFATTILVLWLAVLWRKLKPAHDKL